LNWLGVSSGAQWLDVGCGTGILSQTILDTASPKMVAGVEPSEEYIEFAHKRIQDPRVSFRLGDVQVLPAEVASYDAAVSGLVPNFVPQPSAN
jgi:ubiquinone/menaquinone biosynthesis C-methylase UbiE